MACFSSKTIGTVLLATQVVPAGGVVIAELSVASMAEIMYAIHFGREVTTALTLPFNFRIEGAFVESGGGYWFPLVDMYKGVATEHASAVAAAESEAVAGAVAAGQNVITVASTTNLVVGDRIFIRNATVANSEWGKIKSLVVNTSVTIEDNLLRAQTGATLFDQAELFSGIVNVAPLGRIRVVADGAGAGQNTAVEVIINQVK